MRYTPMVDAMMKFCFGTDEEFVRIKDAAKLERELNAANERIKRLEEAGVGLMKSINCGCSYGPSVFNCQTCTNSWDSWRKAKEAKP